ncbi:MAG TPA: deoxyguanosinetriphosphate triphosphohydrolase, partial [candidate division WOR-3 bacterium]|nr:deoxyguanosinetriphosphate triphosphohydrolase [candidate division WOR-3 bacterium]
MLEDIERETLAPYGMKSSDTRGRKHPEDPPHFRTEFQ